MEVQVLPRGPRTPGQHGAGQQRLPYSSETGPLFGMPVLFTYAVLVATVSLGVAAASRTLPLLVAGAVWGAVIAVTALAHHAYRCRLADARRR